MFRFDGEVFLFGTAIAAPLKSIKIATICASFSGLPRGGGRIVANRGSYSVCTAERKRSSLGFDLPEQPDVRFRPIATFASYRPSRRQSVCNESIIEAVMKAINPTRLVSKPPRAPSTDVIQATPIQMSAAGIIFVGTKNLLALAPVR